MDTEVSFTGRKMVGGATDHSSTASIEIKNAWSCTFTPPYTSRRSELLHLTTRWTGNISAYNVGSRQSRA